MTQELKKVRHPCLTKSNEVFGSDTFIDDFVGGKKVTVGEIYFKPDKLRNWSAGCYQTLDLFEKIRMVGKGN